MDLVKIGKFISKLRKEKRLTQSELGAKLGVSGKAVSKWERGLCVPDISSLNELSEILGITTTELLLGDKKCNSNSSEETYDIVADGINYYTNNEKKKIIKISLFAIFILLFCFFFLFTINNYNKCNVYTIASLSEDFQIEGIIAENQNKKRFIINKIFYIDKYKGTSSEIKVNRLEVELRTENKIIINKEIELDSEILSDALEKIDINIEELVDNKEYRVNSDELKQLMLVIRYNDLNDNSNEVNIGLKIEKEFANNKIIY